jgi:hypothetical protein
VRARGTALLVPVLVATCQGCFRHADRPGNTGPPVDYVRRSFQSSLAGCTDPRGVPATCVRIEIEYDEPTRATVELARAVARFVAATVLRPVSDAGPPESAEALRDDLYESYREIQRNAPDYGVRWELERRMTVVCNTERVQGLVASERAFTGGARPIERVQYVSFDTHTGARIGLDALVAPEQRAQLLAELAHRRQAAPGTTPTSSMWSRGTEAPAERDAAPDSVLVCPDALTFRWDDGRGGDVVVPHDEIRPLLRADAP